MTWTPTSSPTRRAAAAPASVAAFTEPTSPRTIAVTRPASTFCQPTKTTFAVLTMASAASIMPINPRVSTIPSASPTSRFSLSGIGSGDSTPGGDGKLVNYDVAFDEQDLVNHVGDNAGMVRQETNAIAGLERRAPRDTNHRIF